MKPRKRLVLERPEDIKAFLDPFRTRIMRLLRAMDRSMTVKEIADELGEVPAKVHYHVKKLEGIGVLYIEHTRVVNGIIAKYYDFAADAISLSAFPASKDNTDLISQMSLIYSGYFDEQKQIYYDIVDWKLKSGRIGNHDAAFLLKDRYPVDPDKVDELMLKIEDLIKEYREEDGSGVPYSAFMSLLRYPPKDPKENQSSPSKTGSRER